MSTHTAGSQFCSHLRTLLVNNKKTVRSVHTHVINKLTQGKQHCECVYYLLERDGPTIWARRGTHAYWAEMQYFKRELLLLDYEFRLKLWINSSAFYFIQVKYLHYSKLCVEGKHDWEQVTNTGSSNYLYKLKHTVTLSNMSLQYLLCYWDRSNPRTRSWHRSRLKNGPVRYLYRTAMASADEIAFSAQLILVWKTAISDVLWRRRRTHQLILPPLLFHHLLLVIMVT